MVVHERWQEEYSLCLGYFKTHRLGSLGKRAVFETSLFSGPPKMKRDFYLKRRTWKDIMMNRIWPRNTTGQGFRVSRIHRCVLWSIVSKLFMLRRRNRAMTRNLNLGRGAGVS